MAKKPRTLSRDIFVSTEVAKSLIHNVRSVMEGFSKEDDPDAALSIAESETDLLEVIDKAVTRVFELEDMSDALKTRAQKIAARKKRLDDQAELLRASIQNAMGAIEQTKLELPQATLSVRPVAPKLAITDEAMIPSVYWKPQDPVLDRVALTAALKAQAAKLAEAGDDKDLIAKLAKDAIPGATLSNGGETISIKAV